LQQGKGGMSQYKPAYKAPVYLCTCWSTSCMTNDCCTACTKVLLNCCLCMPQTWPASAHRSLQGSLRAVHPCPGCPQCGQGGCLPGSPNCGPNSGEKSCSSFLHVLHCCSCKTRAAQQHTQLHCTQLPSRMRSNPPGRQALVRGPGQTPSVMLWSSVWWLMLLCLCRMMTSQATSATRPTRSSR
jgi:hypothetical protein